jgi:hypothetical protein
MKNVTTVLLQETRTRLDAYGLTATWLTYLKTHITHVTEKRKQSNFSTHPDFITAQTEKVDLLANLTIEDIGILYEFSLAHVNPASRKEAGVYYTPVDVAEIMASKSLQFPKGVWLDPCSGTGNLSHALAGVQPDPEQFILESLILQDLDPLALKIAQTLLVLSYRDKIDDLYGRIVKNFRVENYITSTQTDYNYVIMNPPYLAVKPFKEVDDFITRDCTDLYAYFLEKTILNTQGFISITPQSHLNSTKFKPLRNLLMKHMKQVDMYAFDNIPDTVFKGFKYGSSNTNTNNSVRASITVAYPTAITESNMYRITPLLKWRASERETLLKRLDEWLTSFSPEIDCLFPKLTPKTVNLYTAVNKPSCKTLGTLFSKQPTEYKLIIPGTPRYYIAATKRDLSRLSYRTLYFSNEKDMNTAYLLLNSSYMYWWWRVVDNGMTLSLQTLKTLPLIPVTASSSTVTRIETSEVVNLVTKANAGKLNENVKHPQQLVSKINTLLFPNDTVLTEHLLSLHKNSFI